MPFFHTHNPLSLNPIRASQRASGLKFYDFSNNVIRNLVDFFFTEIPFLWPQDSSKNRSKKATKLFRAKKSKITFFKTFFNPVSGYTLHLAKL